MAFWRPLFEAPLARTLGLKVAVLGFKLGLGQPRPFSGLRRVRARTFVPAPGFPFFKGLKPFGGSWGLLGACWGLSWPFRGKMKGCPKPSISVPKNRISIAGTGILGSPFF